MSTSSNTFDIQGIEAAEQAMILDLIQQEIFESAKSSGPNASGAAFNNDVDVFPDVHMLFRHYNHLYFENKLDFCRQGFISSMQHLLSC
jgi:hypothetical protein